MKINIARFVYEAPGIEIIPETEYEAAVLSRYWENAKLTIGRAASDLSSADGHCYSVKFKGGKQPQDLLTKGRLTAQEER